MEGDKSVKIEKLLENADKRIQFLKNRWISLEFEVFALRASFSFISSRLFSVSIFSSFPFKIFVYTMCVCVCLCV